MGGQWGAEWGGDGQSLSSQQLLSDSMAAPGVAASPSVLRFSPLPTPPGCLCVEKTNSTLCGVPGSQPPASLGWSALVVLPTY